MNQSTQITGGRVRRTASAASVAALVVALVGAAASPAAAQCGSTGEAGDNICGQVTNTAGDGISGVTVKVTGDGFDEGITDENGFYSLSAGGAGDWTVFVVESTIPTGSDVTPPQKITVSVDSFGNPSVHPDVDFEVSPPEPPGENLEIVPSPCDFVTSGGFVMSDSNKKISFGAHGGCKNGEFWGHVNVVDHSTGYHINSDEITGFIAPLGVAEPTRDICGWASTNNNADAPLVRFRVRLRDNGEPGSLDLWGIVLGPQAAAPYLVEPRLLSAQKPGGGNVQLHKPNPSTTAPSPVPSDFDMCGGVVFP